MELYLDEVAVDRNRTLRVGWVVCLVQIRSVEVFVDGGASAKRNSAGRATMSDGQGRITRMPVSRASCWSAI
jgi:hypothetical protein